MTGCQRKGCTNWAAYRPVLLFRATPKGPAATGTPLGLDVCAQCKEKLGIEDLVTDEGWAKIVRNFEKAGYVVPRRDLVEIRWEPLGGEN